MSISARSRFNYPTAARDAKSGSAIGPSIAPTAASSSSSSSSRSQIIDGSIWAPKITDRSASSASGHYVRGFAAAHPQAIGIDLSDTEEADKALIIQREQAYADRQDFTMTLDGKTHFTLASKFPAGVLDLSGRQSLDILPHSFNLPPFLPEDNVWVPAQFARRTKEILDLSDSEVEHMSRKGQRPGRRHHLGKTLYNF